MAAMAPSSTVVSASQFEGDNHVSGDAGIPGANIPRGTPPLAHTGAGNDAGWRRKMFQIEPGPFTLPRSGGWNL